MADADPATESDGRAARKERGKQAVLDAALELFVELDDPPTSEQLAKRSGVSTSSIFRYFETIYDIRRAATARFLERQGSLLDRAPLAEDLDQRVDEFVRLRVDCGLTFAPVLMKIIQRSSDAPALDELRLELMARMTAQVDRYFGPELGQRSPVRRDNIAAVLDTSTNLAAFLSMSGTHERTAQQVRTVWRQSVDALIATL